MPELEQPEETLPRAVHSLIADQAYEAIRQSITGGRFRPGDQLVEARLATELGISRGPVREGLKRLRQEGLVVHRPHQGTFVRELTAEDVVAMYDVRVALESVAIRLLTKRAAVPPELERIIASMRSAAAADDVGGLISLGYRFHHALCEESGNAIVLDFFDVISSQVQLALELDTVEYLRHADLADYVDSHADLVETIRSGDEYAAASLLEEHVLEGLGFLLTRLAGDDGAVEAIKPKLLGPEDRAFQPAR